MSGKRGLVGRRVRGVRGGQARGRDAALRTGLGHHGNPGRGPMPRPRHTPGPLRPAVCSRQAPVSHGVQTDRQTHTQSSGKTCLQRARSCRLCPCTWTHTPRTRLTVEGETLVFGLSHPNTAKFSSACALPLRENTKNSVFFQVISLGLFSEFGIFIILCKTRTSKRGRHVRPATDQNRRGGGPPRCAGPALPHAPRTHGGRH